MKIRRFGCRIGRFLFHSYRDFCRNNVVTVGRNDIPTECHHGQPMFLFLHNCYRWALSYRIFVNSYR